MKFNRRDFLKKSAAAGAAIAVPTIVPASVFGANAPSNRVTFGIIGLRNQGSVHLHGLKPLADAEVVALCDVDSRFIKQGQDIIGLGEKDCYKDYRDVLAREDIDAVVICTPDHWHVPMSLAAAKAGKDIYIEKPMSRMIKEGRRLCDTVKRYGRVLQVGSMQRSSRHFRFACELVRNGYIGKLHTIKVGLPNGHPNILKWKVSQPPAELDYDLWLGPASWRPYIEKAVHYNWHYGYNYSGGQMCNWGAHHLDIAQWGNGSDDSGPVEVEGKGEFASEGLWEVPLKNHVEYTYANGVKLLCDTDMHSTDGGGARIEGSEGWVYVSRGRIEAGPKSLLSVKIRPDEINLYQSNDHKRDFIDCVKRRKEPNSTVEIGHRTATLCHLGNIAMLLKRKLKWDPVKEVFVGDDEANRHFLMDRSMRSPWQF